MATVEDLVARDVRHRAGWRPSETTDEGVTKHLISEAHEVHAEPKDPDELADVLAIVFYQAHRAV